MRASDEPLYHAPLDFHTYQISSCIILCSQFADTVPTNSGITAFTAPTKTFMYETDNFQVKRTLVSSSTTAFTPTVTTFTTTAIPRHFSKFLSEAREMNLASIFPFNVYIFFFFSDVVTPSVSNNQIPRLNPIMVVETPRLATTVAPTSPTSIQPSTLTLHPYIIPQGESYGQVSRVRFGGRYSLRVVKKQI